MIAVCVLATACGEDSTGADASSVATISFAQSAMAISQGETRTLAVQFKDAQGAVLNDITNATWVSSNTAVLDVSQQGVAQGLALGGPVDVTVNVGGKSATATVSVIPERIRFTPADSTIVLGQTLQLSGIIEDHNLQPIATNAAITWSSAHQGVATVDATTGLVTSIASGYATIRASAAGRTTEKRIQVGVPTVYDGHWSGVTAAAPHGSAVQISFDVVMGQVKNFTARWSGNTPCGLLSSSALGTEAGIVSNAFELTLAAPTPGTIIATFTSQTQMTGVHTTFSFGSLATCPMQGGGFQNVTALAAAGTLTATR
jgi:hypothetical protein